MSEKLLSIILPAYNAEKTIKRAVDSVLCSKSDDFELIVIDDGSKDSTNDIVRSYNDPRLSLITKENSGVSSTRNYGIEKATGKYITFIDSDDEYIAGAIDRILSYANSEDFDLLGFGYYGEWIKNGKVYKTDANSVSQKLSFNIEDAAPYFRYIFESSHILLQTSWNKVFKREIMAENGIRFDESMVCYENLTMIFDYLKYARKIVFLNDILYKYCFYAESNVNVIQKRKKLDLTSDVSKCYEKFIELCEKYSYDDQYRAFMDSSFLNDFVYCSRKYFDKSEQYSKSQQLDAFSKYLRDDGMTKLRNGYLSGMTFYRLIFTLNDKGLKHIAYALYKKMIIK